METEKINPYENEMPIIKLVHETLNKSVHDCLEKNYFSAFGHVTKWKCFSDYSYDLHKPNDVITFTLLPHTVDQELLANIINTLAPSEIKNTSQVNLDFMKFIRQSCFITFSFIVENHKHLFAPNRDILKDFMLLSMNNLIDTDIPGWTAKRPHLATFHWDLEKKIKNVIHLIKQDKKIRILKNLFLTIAIGSVIATHFANRTKAEIFGWFSDRDEIHDVANGFAIDLFSILFAEHLIKWDCQFAAAPASSKDNEWYKDLVKIPDFITGALADYDFSTRDSTHKKFVVLLRELICDNDRNVFVFKLKFNNDTSMECSRIRFAKVMQSENGFS